MKTYYNGSAGEISVTVSPAAHLAKGDLPAAWRDEAGEPLSFTIHFKGGEAITTPELARYLSSQGIARTTKLILPGLRLAA